MMLLTHRPGPRLGSYVEMLWYYDVHQTAHQKERVLPNGRFQMVIDLATGLGAVSGMRSHGIDIDTASIQSAMGVVFRPGGARAFFDGPASDFYNQAVPLDAVWDARMLPWCSRLRDVVTAGEKCRLLEAALLEAVRTRVERQMQLHPCVQYALRVFRGVPHVRTVVNVSTEAGLSRRRFSQVFREQVGMTPKAYCRLLRFRQVVREVAAGRPVDWSAVALAAGYYDHAHLAHEFRDFSGMSPGRYLASARPFVNHVRID